MPLREDPDVLFRRRADSLIWGVGLRCLKDTPVGDGDPRFETTPDPGR